MRCWLWGVVIVAGSVQFSHGEDPFPSHSMLIRVPGEDRLLRVENPPPELIPAEARPFRRPNDSPVARAVNRELRNASRALRQLDQSYALRGFQGCGAATAGSVFIDWQARGLTPPNGIQILPPEPIVLGIPKWHRREQCDRLHTKQLPCDCSGTELSPTPLPRGNEFTPAVNR